MKAMSSVFVALVACACSRNVPTHAPATTTPVVPVATVPPAESKSPTRSVVTIAEDIRKACGIAETEAHFAFDSAHVRATDAKTFDRLVRCFSTGPLANREMRLVGHADPRGSEEYNLALGGSRADNVRQALLERGLPRARAATTSRGEMDAAGTDEATWAEDRRVDIHLAN